MSFILVIGRLTGPIPNWLPKLPVLSYINVAGNKLSGLIPESIGECRNLREFYASDNMLSGKVPADALMKCRRLAMFELGSHTENSAYHASCTEFMKEARKQRGIAWGQGNKDLTITAMGKAMLMPMLVAGLKEEAAFQQAGPFDEIAFFADPDKCGHHFPAVVG